MKKQVISIVFIFIILFGILPTTVFAEELPDMRNTYIILVDGKAKILTIYLIGPNKYFKLRDIAYILNGTEKQFDVIWEDEKNTVSLVPGMKYTPVGGEMKLFINNYYQEFIKAKTTNSKFYINDSEIQFLAYKINGNNYIKLLDLAKFLDFEVKWTKNTNSVEIISTKGYTSENDGTPERPFLVSTANDLKKVGAEINEYGWSPSASYKLTNNITVDNWIPIGENRFLSPKCNNTYRFFGTFDGNGHTVTINSFNHLNNSKENSDKYEYVGLFGIIEEPATVKNLAVIGTFPSTKESGTVGIIAANNIGTIKNCYAKGIVSTSKNKSNAGGIVGFNHGLIQNCYVTGTVTNPSANYYDDGYVGGIATQNLGTILNCYATNSVSGKNYCGGITGFNYTTGNVENCLALNAYITGANNTKSGRIIGVNQYSSTEWSGKFPNSKAISINGIKNITKSDGIGNETPINGTEIKLTEVFKQSTFGTHSPEGLGWSFGNTEDFPWKWGGTNYPLPVLYWQTEDTIPYELPLHLNIQKLNKCKNLMLNLLYYIVNIYTLNLQ